MTGAGKVRVYDMDPSEDALDTRREKEIQYLEGLLADKLLAGEVRNRNILDASQ